MKYKRVVDASFRSKPELRSLLKILKFIHNNIQYSEERKSIIVSRFYIEYDSIEIDKEINNFICAWS